MAVADAAAAVALAVRLEEGMALRWRDLVGGADDDGLRGAWRSAGCRRRRCGRRPGDGVAGGGPVTVALPGHGLDPPGHLGQRRVGGGRLGLLEQHALRGPVQRLGVRRRVADRGQPDPAGLREAADHVEHDAGLPRLVEVQAVAGDDVEQVVEA